MKRLSVFLILAITLSVAVGMTFRHKRQLSDDEDENNLDDRYGDRPEWNRPNQGWEQQRPRPNQNSNQWPNQNIDPWPRPNQNNNQWPQPNQGENQPNQGGNRPNQNDNQWPQPNQQGNQGNQPRPTTPAPNGNGSTTTQSSAVQQCIRDCPVTSEYNPVCGTNLVQYTNPGRLTCAQNCGVNVSLLRASPCPATTTAAPAS